MGPHSRKAFWAHIHLTGGGHVPGPHSTDFHPSTPWLTVLPFRYIHHSDPAAWPRTQLLAIRTSKPADSRIDGRFHRLPHSGKLPLPFSPHPRQLWPLPPPRSPSRVRAPRLRPSSLRISWRHIWASALTSPSPHRLWGSFIRI